MISWSNLHQSLDRLTRRVAPLVARVSGILIAVGGAFRFWQGLGGKALQPFVFGVLLMALGVGVGLLRPTALRLLTILLVAFAIVLPAGVLNPHAEIDRLRPRVYPPGYESIRIAEILGVSAAAILLAHLTGLARLQRVDAKAKTSTATPVPPEQ